MGSKCEQVKCIQEWSVINIKTIAPIKGYTGCYHNYNLGYILRCWIPCSFNCCNKVCALFSLQCTNSNGSETRVDFTIRDLLCQQCDESIIMTPLV